ncbi:MAG: DNA-binding beta-propeller fold protein YncE [Crocinitomix sp.]|jgi:DNA-binding beta-propeller fold protein YncE
MKYYYYIAVLFVLIACNKKPLPPAIPAQYDSGIVVLNEGLFEQNNSSLTFYDGTTSYQQVFKSENGRGLGDTANDFDTYSFGGKQYIIIAVDVSSQVEIIDRKTLKVVAQIPFFDGINAREPRQIKVHGTRALVCNFDGTVGVIDLISNTLVDLIEVGANPDGLAIVNDKLYVSNSGGLNYPIYDSTVSVIDLATLIVEETFETRINCSQMIVDGQDEIYLVSRGNYDDISPALLRIDAATNTVLEISEMEIGSIAYYNNWIYFYNGDEEAVYRYDTQTEMVEPTPFMDVSSYETFGGIIIDETNERLFCLDVNGYVNSSTIIAHNLSGEFLFEFTGGLIASDLIFNN